MSKKVKVVLVAWAVVAMIANAWLVKLLAQDSGDAMHGSDMMRGPMMNAMDNSMNQMDDMDMNQMNDNDNDSDDNMNMGTEGTGM